MMPDQPARSHVYAIAHRHVERTAALNPIAATAMGIPGYDDQLTDFSPEGDAARAALARDSVAALDTAPIAGERDRVAREAMGERLRLQLELYEAGEQYRALNILHSPLQVIRQCFDLMPHDTAEHWRNVAERLRRVPAALASYRTTLEAGLERGLRATTRQVTECATQAQVWSGGRAGTPSYFAQVIGGYEQAGIADDALMADLEAAAPVAAAAYAAFRTFLLEHYLPRAEPLDPVGRERYARAARVYNGTALDLDETYDWGWQELARIESEVAATCERIVPGATIDAVQQLLETDPARAIDGVDAFTRWMQELQERTIAELDGTHFDIPAPVKRIEALIAPPGGALAMYYTGPSEDFSRPGRTWYPTAGRTRFPLWGEVSIAYHEGVPGHHLQIAHVVYLADRLSRYQRLMGTTSGYAEGWALYAERLMAELGYLDNPDYYLGMLRAQALRAARVVVDIGLHLERDIPTAERFHPGERWTPEFAHQFMRERSYFPPDFLASEVTRYLGLPGQAISYKVGERVWLEARAAAQRTAGNAFDLKAFHARALDLGPMGLAQLRRELGEAAHSS